MPAHPRSQAAPEAARAGRREERLRQPVPRVGRPELPGAAPPVDAARRGPRRAVGVHREAEGRPVVGALPRPRERRRQRREALRRRMEGRPHRQVARPVRAAVRQSRPVVGPRRERCRRPAAPRARPSLSLPEWWPRVPHRRPERRTERMRRAVLAAPARRLRARSARDSPPHRVRRRRQPGPPPEAAWLAERHSAALRPVDRRPARPAGHLARRPEVEPGAAAAAAREGPGRLPRPAPLSRKAPCCCRHCETPDTAPCCTLPARSTIVPRDTEH